MAYNKIRIRKDKDDFVVEFMKEIKTIFFRAPIIEWIILYRVNDLILALKCAKGLSQNPILVCNSALEYLSDDKN